MTQSIDNSLKVLRLAAWIEGISFLVLLLVAMPLKYLAGMPEAVRVVGMIHGVLFVWFVVAAVQAKAPNQWSLMRLARLIATSLVPFGMLLFDRMLAVEARVEA